MANLQELGFYDHQAIYKINSGGIRFKMMAVGTVNPSELTLIARHDPNVCLYKLTFGYETIVYSIGDKQGQRFPSADSLPYDQFKDYYLTWHSNQIKVGIVDQKPFVNYQKMNTDPIVGYILFKTRYDQANVEWVIETSPVILESIPCKTFSERLHWNPMINGQLPPDAMIGGFDDELIYVARAKHNASLCPGKYVPSTGKAFVPWGHREYAKEDFEVQWHEKKHTCYSIFHYLLLELGFYDHQAIYKINSGGIRFKMMAVGTVNPSELTLIARHDPNVCLYKLTFGYETIVYSIGDKQGQRFPSADSLPYDQFKDYYLTWHSNQIKVGIVDQKPFVNYQKMNTDPIVGYILFKTRYDQANVEWVIETSPVILESIPCKTFSERLHWNPMINGQLPPDAMIGGFDDELIYVARAKHNASLCPGKYVPSTGKAFVPWGHREYAKEDFEVQWHEKKHTCYSIFHYLLLELGFYDHQAIYKINSGGIRFKMMAVGTVNPSELTLIARHDPNVCLYKLTFGYETIVYSIGDKQGQRFPSADSLPYDQFKDYYLTWHSNQIKVGIVDQKPFVNYQKMNTDPIVGYILFKTRYDQANVEWVIETSPVILESIPCKTFSERLHWNPMINGQLPPDAMIGGFDDELIYVARAKHNASLCPGKYVPSTGKAFVPWGHREYAKEDFEILCGFNAKWVKTRTNYIPQNAFIGGYSEVNNEPLYIGRAMIMGSLICGKVHLLYKTCYLPFQGNEVEVSNYEILVLPDDEIPQAITCGISTLEQQW